MTGLIKAVEEVLEKGTFTYSKEIISNAEACRMTAS